VCPGFGENRDQRNRVPTDLSHPPLELRFGRARLPRAEIAQDPPVVLASPSRVDDRVKACATDERTLWFSAEGECSCDDPAAERVAAKVDSPRRDAR
jgi:hypothetical protein